MRFCLVLIVFLSVILSVGAVFAAPAVVVEKLDHDFGAIIEGDQVEYSFRFHNAGDQVLEIGQLRSSCGCTAALLSARRLEPGMLGELRVKFASQGFRGQVQKMVTFETNDPKHSAITFSLRGTVKSEFYVNPQRVNWGRVSREASLTKEVEVINDSSVTIILQPPEVTSANILAELSSEVLAAGERTTVKITVKFPEEQKRLAGYVILRSNFAPVPQIKLPVSARLSQN
ncbi:MAG: DUF1573 domain-containing protein [Deltaproteobacteria bacterium]|nr:DUF1573 domain-containing protein [Deltaproteobacteria bacterium]